MSIRYKNHSNILPLFERLGGISHNLSTLLLYLKHTTPPKKLNLNQGVVERWLKCLPLHQPLGSIYSENKRLECPCELKGKLYLMKDNLVRLSLCCTRCHLTDCFLLYFYTTSVMMSCSSPAVAPLPVLRQNWETLVQLASRWSKLLDLDVCLTPFSSH
jgi:hypothetical protein